LFPSMYNGACSPKNTFIWWTFPVLDLVKHYEKMIPKTSKKTS
jgi:hypothetical protein